MLGTMPRKLAAPDAPSRYDGFIKGITALKTVKWEAETKLSRCGTSQVKFNKGPHWFSLSWTRWQQVNLNMAPSSHPILIVSRSLDPMKELT